jgi:hypothetical protein
MVPGRPPLDWQSAFCGRRYVLISVAIPRGRLPTLQLHAKVPRVDPEETCERLPKAFLFTARDFDPCQPVPNLTDGPEGTGAGGANLCSSLWYTVESFKPEVGQRTCQINQ